MLSEYELKITDLYDIPISSTKMYRILEFNQSQWLKQYVEFNTKKKNRSRKKW